MRSPTAVPDIERPPLSWAEPEWASDPVVTDGPLPRPPWRSMASALLAATSVVCLLLGNVALWMRQDLYSTRAADQQARQIMRSSNVQAAVGNLIVTDVIEPAIDRAPLGVLRGIVSAPAISLARRAVDDAMASQSAQQVATRLVTQVVPQLDRGTGPVTLSPEQLAWVASPRLAGNRAVAAALGTAERTGCCRVTLVQRGQLGFAWRHVRTVRTAGAVLPPLGLLAGALAVAVSRRRVVMGMILAAGTATAGIVTLAALSAGPGPWGSLASRAGPAAGVVLAAQHAVFTSATAGLRWHSLCMAGAGVAVLAVLAALTIGGRPTRPGTGAEAAGAAR
ncbi:MAG TPA: hypothetical protein VMU14_10020 [Acidimicrobiales bacterium]|nr:hypothetical protein [Acidimicrobiales bacterium]